MIPLQNGVKWGYAFLGSGKNSEHHGSRKAAKRFPEGKDGLKFAVWLAREPLPCVGQGRPQLVKAMS